MTVRHLLRDRGTVQTQLQGHAQDSLKALGLSSGDLLFILDFNTTTSTPVAAAAQFVASSLPSETMPMDIAPAQLQHAPQICSGPQQASTSPNPAQAANAAAPAPIHAPVSVSNCSSFMSQLQALWITVQTQLEERGLCMCLQVQLVNFGAMVQ